MSHEINDALDSKLKQSKKLFDTYEKNVLFKYACNDKDGNINVYSYIYGKRYYLPDSELQNFWRHLEACRRENVIMHYQEKQGDYMKGEEHIDHTGIMIDFDIIFPKNVVFKPNQKSSRELYSAETNSQLCEIIFNRICCHLDWFENAPDHADLVNSEAYFMTTIRHAAEEVAPDSHDYKFGFHILIPSLKVTRVYKKYLMNALARDAEIIKCLKGIGVKNAESALDTNSAHVPSLFLGSSKKDKIPYTLAYCTKCAATFARGNDAPSTRIRDISMQNLDKYNMVGECALNGENCIYEDEIVPLVNKQKYNPNQHVALACEDYAMRSGGKLANSDIINRTDIEIARLCQEDPEANIVHELLQILPERYSNEFTPWRDIIYALSSNEKYLPLAHAFSQRSPEKYDKVDTMWRDSLRSRAHHPNPKSIYYIRKIAKLENPEKFHGIMMKHFYNVIFSYVLMYNGELQHYTIAKILKLMVGNKFCTDEAVESRDKRVWYEFVTPAQAMSVGNVWKWRLETNPEELNMYISERIAPIITDIKADMMRRLTKEIERQNEEGVKDDNITQYFKGALRNIDHTIKNLFNDTFKNGIIRQAAYLFRRYDFTKSLDKDPGICGVSNGVVQLGEKCELIDYYHDHRISKYTPCSYSPWDPEMPGAAIVLKCLEDAFIEDDAREFYCFIFCQGLSNGPKDSRLHIWLSDGSSAKSTILLWLKRVLGAMNAITLPMTIWIKGKQLGANDAAPAMMAIDGKNFAYSEETNGHQIMDPAMLKTVTGGEVSGRQLFGELREFTSRAVLIIASNYSLEIPTIDYGTWRRLVIYKFKCRMVPNPDPNNPFERKEDTAFRDKYSDDYNVKNAFFALLCHFYERLQREYGGNAKNIVSPTVQRETQNYRLEQDNLHAWISRFIVISPDHAKEYEIAELARFYLVWFTNTVRNRTLQDIKAIIENIQNSCLQKYIRTSTGGITKLVGCRYLDSPSLLKNEKYINDSSHAMSAEIQYRRPNPNWWRARIELEDDTDYEKVE